MGLVDAISFLSIIPVRYGSLEKVSTSQHWFPVVGLLLGVISGGVGWIVSLYAEPLLAAVAALATLSIITGLHHTDGLADFADGLMGRGDSKKRLQIMRDKMVGTGGITAVILCIACFLASASQVGGMEIFVAIIVAEVAAKYSMIVASYLGRPAGGGSGATFCANMNRRQLIISTAWWVVPVIFAPQMVWPMLAGVLTSITILYIAKRTIHGMTGDVFGAINEASRAVSIAVVVSI